MGTLAAPVWIPEAAVFQVTPHARGRLQTESASARQQDAVHLWRYVARIERGDLLASR